MPRSDRDIDAAIALFPATFGLRGFPGDVFKIDRQASYINDFNEVTLYTYVLRGKDWLSFAKGTVKELQSQVIGITDRFILDVELGNSAMCTGDDLGRLLREIASDVRELYGYNVITACLQMKPTSGFVNDRNGNRVGSWSIRKEHMR